MPTLAILSTGHFDFHALGRDRRHAEAVMRAAWSKHKSQTGATGSWAEFADDVNYHDLAMGEALRDGSLLVEGVR